MEGSANRIACNRLSCRVTVEEMINLDLGYTRPFPPVWDPVVIAAREVARKL